MEGPRFDRWTVGFGQALGRRRFAALLSLLGLAAMPMQPPEAAAKKHKKTGKGKKGKGKNKHKHKHKKTCKQGALKCGKRCVNPKSNAQHCGGCNRGCGPNVACVNGACEAEDCPGGPCACAAGTACGTDCVDTQTDNDHCGNCQTVCGQGESCQSGHCTSGPSGCGSGGNCLVFATSTLYTGKLGGLTGADQQCNDRAQAAGLTGVYKAWLADSTGSPSSRFVHSTGPYVLVGGLTAADDWAGLTNPDDLPNHHLDHEINRDEFGNEITTDDLWRFTWTNVQPDGTANDDDRHCQNWSTNEGTPNFGNGGNVNATDSFWTYATSIFCNNPGLRLYCFQQS